MLSASARKMALTARAGMDRREGDHTLSCCVEPDGPSVGSCRNFPLDLLRPLRCQSQCHPTWTPTLDENCGQERNNLSLLSPQLCPILSGYITHHTAWLSCLSWHDEDEGIHQSVETLSGLLETEISAVTLFGNILTHFISYSLYIISYYCISYIISYSYSLIMAL
jgi:hypothetical protein